MGDDIPDPAPIRTRIKAAVSVRLERGKKATLGLICDAVESSISYGAPAYNDGQIAECAEFYLGTTKILVSAFGESEATPDAEAALAELRHALACADGLEDEDQAAWFLRYGFDRVVLAAQIAEAEAKALIALGDQYHRRGMFREAARSFGAAADRVVEVVGDDPERVDLDARLAPLARGHALFSLGEYVDSARSIVDGLAVVPDWPSYDITRRSFHPDSGHYQALLDRLLDQAESTHAPDLLFLVGYEYYFSPRREESRAFFDRVLEVDDAHIGAATFRHALTPQWS